MLPRLYRRLRAAMLRTRIAQLELAVFNAALDPAQDAAYLATLMIRTASTRAALRALEA